MDTHANDAYFNVYLPLLAEGIAPPLPVVGGSMSPYLVSGRDHVFLCPLRGERLRVGDICLYRRENGAYILHRIVGKKNGTFTFAGDAQTEREYGIRREQILARVKLRKNLSQAAAKGILSCHLPVSVVYYMRTLYNRPDSARFRVKLCMKAGGARLLPPLWE